MKIHYINKEMKIQLLDGIEYEKDPLIKKMYDEEKMNIVKIANIINSGHII